MWRVLMLASVLAVLAICPVQAALNVDYLAPGAGFKINKQFRTTRDPVKICALTFDDGPDETYTMQVLATLDRYQVKATFFLVGERVAEFPGQVKALAQSGHEIGNHTYSHPDMAALGEGSQRREITRAMEQLRGLGVEPRWFRPPYGSASRTTIHLAENLGMDVIRWSVDPRDWAQPGVEVIARRVLKETCPGGVILLHSTNAQTLAALPVIIEKLRGEGYSFVTMSQWKSVVTGAKSPETVLHPKLPDYTEIKPVDLSDPFYQAFLKGVPVVYDELEQLNPADSAHALWNNPERLAAAPLLESTKTGGTALTVYSNFKNANDLPRVLSQGGSTNLFACHSAVPASEPALETPPAPVEDTGLPVETMEHPTVASPPPAPRPQAGSGTVAKDGELHPAGPSVPAWETPGKISTADLAGDDTGSLELYLVVPENSLPAQSWNDLAVFCRRARISGLVLPTTTFFGTPPPGLACAWTFAGPRYLDGLAVVDLDDRAGERLLALAGAGITRVIVKAPGGLDTAAAHRFIILRQLTTGLAPAQRPRAAEGWDLPDGVALHCLSGNGRHVLVLVNSTEQTTTAALPAGLRRYTAAGLGSDGRAVLTPVEAGSITIDPGTTMLCYEAMGGT